ncbi:HAD family phosphatase [Kitasatospora sp. NPDC001539]|uniref:HAD family hydrolase n=1 Tax=Kitasatospora sp. NPDC001539 TaxID=3154384 RepID=UPI0033345D39
MAQRSVEDEQPPGYRGLILDFVGVLTEGVRESIAAWALAEGLDADAWRRTLTTDPVVRRLYTELELGRLPQAEWNARTGAVLGVDGDNLMGRAWAAVRPATEMVRFAREARRAGYTVALLSNSFGLDPYDPYGATGVWELFDVAVVSEREGIAKPDPTIYRTVLDRMGLAAASCVFVDDQPANLLPAAELGITTVLADGLPGTVGHLARLLGLDPGSPATEPVVAAGSDAARP